MSADHTPGKRPAKEDREEGTGKRMKQAIEKKISDTLFENYMPYAMSVIVSRAIPEIDGFKPAHRKLL